jgi:class 3 adenylate cyclase
VTVVFSDVVGSTALAERLDTETFTLLMDRYFDRMSGVAEGHGGTVAKFIGDAIVVVFGVPRAHEDDALRAIKTAMEMRQALQALNKELEPRWGVTLGTKTAVNTGEILATTRNLDDDPVGRGGHIAVGDAMNLGARLEQAAGDGEIVLGEATYRLVGEAVEATRMPPLVLKGKADPVSAYRLVGISPHPEAIARHLDSPMIGRGDDLANLQLAFSGARRDKSCRLVTVMGPAGVGKSRLVEEFLGSVGDGATKLSGHCLSRRWSKRLPASRIRTMKRRRERRSLAGSSALGMQVSWRRPSPRPLGSQLMRGCPPRPSGQSASSSRVSRPISR